MTDTETQYLFLIGAYRDNEVNSTHPLAIAVADIRASAAEVNQITLTTLAKKNICKGLETKPLQVDATRFDMIPHTQHLLFVPYIEKALYNSKLYF